MSAGMITNGRDNSRFRTLLHEIEAQGEWEEKRPFFPTLTKLFLVTGLGFLSWLATYSGMMELIQANAGEIDTSYKVAIGFAVAMLMLMIIYLLDSLFSPIRWWLRLTYICGYAFLTLISVGFGFGFYWKFLESHSEATRSANAAVENVQLALQSGQTRLEQLQMTFGTLTQVSQEKAELERTVGGTCPKSPPGDGPRRRLRDADADNFRFAGNFVRQRAGLVQKQISDLNTYIITSGASEALLGHKTGNRNAFHRQLNQKLNLTLTRFNAFRTDPQLLEFRNSFAKRAEQKRFPNGRGRTFYCPDSQLQTALRGVVSAIDGLPQLEKTTIASVEGSEAIIEAFRRLTVSAFGLITFQPPLTPEQIRNLQQDGKPVLTMQSGLGPRDYIPLFIALFVDLCLLLVSINRPVNRLQGFLNTARQAQQTKVHKILKSFHDVHDSRRSQRLDILQKVMFDAGTEQYIAVPLDMRTKFKKARDQEEFLNAKKWLTEIRYISTIMATLEDAGLAKRSYFVGSSLAKKKLKKLKSPFSEASAFRVYKFLKGAWPAIILDDTLGEAQLLEREKKLLPPPIKSLEDFKEADITETSKATVEDQKSESPIPQEPLPKIQVRFDHKTSAIFPEAIAQSEEAESKENVSAGSENIENAGLLSNDKAEESPESYHHVIHEDDNEMEDMTDMYIEQIEKEMMLQENKIILPEMPSPFSNDDAEHSPHEGKIQIDKIAQQFAHHQFGNNELKKS